MIGFLDWVITETGTGVEIGRERRDFDLDDITVEDVVSPEICIQNLSLRLTPFVFCLARSLTPEEGGKLTGFGFSAMRDDLPSFSW